MIVSIIPSDKISNHIPRLKELLVSLDEYLQPLGTHSDLIVDGITGSAIFWGVFDQNALEEGEEPLVAVLVTYRRDYWRASVLELVGLAGTPGSMRTWIDLLNKVTLAYAKQTGCVSRHVIGRGPWTRYLARYGFKPSELVMLECPIGEEGRE